MFKLSFDSKKIKDKCKKSPHEISLIIAKYMALQASAGVGRIKERFNEPKSGQVYWHPIHGSYIASALGEPPAYYLGGLHDSTVSSILQSSHYSILEYGYDDSTEYAKYIEFYMDRKNVQLEEVRLLEYITSIQKEIAYYLNK